MMTKKYSVVIVGILIGAAILFLLSLRAKANSQNIVTETTSIQLEEFTAAKLATYDGTDSSKKILIGLDGMVYDVTSGKKYYQKGGTYNWLAGKDSSNELHLIGGDIIKKKYPIVGKIIQ